MVQSNKRLEVEKILIYAPVVGRGGCTLVSKKLARAWLDLGKSVTFLGSASNEIGQKIEWDPRVKILQLDPEPHPTGDRLFSWLKTHTQIHYEHLEKIAPGYDAIWLPMPWHTMRYIQEWDIKIPVIAFLPDFAYDYLSNLISQKDVYGARREAFNFSRWCHKIVLSSDFQRDWAIQKYGMKNTVLIRKPGFVPDNFKSDELEESKFRERYNLNEDYILAMHVYGHKDPFTLLKGYSMAKIIFPQLPKLVLAGLHSESFSPNYPTRDVAARQVQSLIVSADLNWEEHMLFLGFIPEELLGGMYHGAKFVIAPSKSEGGVSGTICEAAESKTPVIYSNIPAHVEVLGESIDSPGYHFQVGNPGDLSLAICKAYINEKHFKKTATRLKELLTGDWLDIAQQYLDLYQSKGGQS